jgi:hypothetical protein
MPKTHKKSDNQLVDEYFNHMIGRKIMGVAIEQDELEVTLDDGSLVVIYSSEDLSMFIQYARKLN